MSDMLDATLDIVTRHKWPVFVLHEPGDGPTGCSCSNPDCRSPAKHPRTGNGFKDASRDPESLRQWWTLWPSGNIGVPTGRPETFDVLDIDGEEGLKEMSRLVGGDNVQLPCGPAVITPHGVHLYFAPTGLGNRARFRPGLDWRGAGGYVVVPPSVGANGQPYRWFMDGDCAP